MRKDLAILLGEVAQARFNWLAKSLEAQSRVVMR